MLELGGNAGAVVHDDAPDLDRLALPLALGAFAYAGQVCIKVQRVLVHERIYDEFARKFVAAAAALAVGDQMDPGTAIGPVIDSAAADRVEAWVEEAIADGATPLLRGHRAGTVLGPTVLAGAPRTAKVSCREVFGPVATLAPYTEWRSALDEVND